MININQINFLLLIFSHTAPSISLFKYSFFVLTQIFTVHGSHFTQIADHNSPKSKSKYHYCPTHLHRSLFSQIAQHQLNRSSQSNPNSLVNDLAHRCNYLEVESVWRSWSKSSILNRRSFRLSLFSLSNIHLNEEKRIFHTNDKLLQEFRWVRRKQKHRAGPRPRLFRP